MVTTNRIPTLLPTRFIASTCIRMFEASAGDSLSAAYTVAYGRAERDNSHYLTLFSNVYYMFDEFGAAVHRPPAAPSRPGSHTATFFCYFSFFILLFSAWPVGKFTRIPNCTPIESEITTPNIY